MTTRLPQRTLMVAFLNRAMTSRKITIEHLADLLQPIPEITVQSWLAGSSSPSPDDLLPLAIALRVNPVELTGGWLIDHNPGLEDEIVRRLLGPLESSFPKIADDSLIAPRPVCDFTVIDPHDEREPSLARLSDGGRVRRRSAASKVALQTP